MVIGKRTVGLFLAIASATVAASFSSAPASARAQQPGAASHASVIDVSRGCAGQNAEVEEATGAPRYVYEIWIGCGGIGFARSTNGGRDFRSPVRLPGSGGFSWDPAITVAANGTIYAAYMHQHGGHMYPVVAASFDHGATFPQVTPVVPPQRGNWGDRVSIAAGRNGNIYLTWDYGPDASDIKLLCSPSGSCAFKAGKFNAVIQKSTDGGKTWGAITPIEPNYPYGGGYSAPLVVQPNGRIDVLYISHPTDRGTLALHPGYEYFTSSRNGSSWPANPQRLWPDKGTLSLPEWWIDGDITTDAGGNLYATWDTQTPQGDIGWLTSSSDGGRTWSKPVRVTPDIDRAAHIVQAAGGRSGVAYVAWQTDASAHGWATYLRPYSIKHGWLGPAVRVSPRFGRKAIWPGDTFGIATVRGGPGTRVALSWGSAIGRSRDSEIYATVVRVPSRK